LRVSGRAARGAGGVALHYSALSAHDNAVKRDTTPKERERERYVCTRERAREGKQRSERDDAVSHTKLDYDTLLGHDPPPLQNVFFINTHTANNEYGG
jgi:hypothetical protein